MSTEYTIVKENLGRDWAWVKSSDNRTMAMGTYENCEIICDILNGETAKLQADLAAAKLIILDAGKQVESLKEAMLDVIDTMNNSLIHNDSTSPNQLKRMREVLAKAIVQSPAPVPSEERQAEITMHASIMQAMNASEAPVSEEKIMADRRQNGTWKAVSKYPTKGESPNYVVCENEDFVTASQLLIRKLLQHGKGHNIYYLESPEKVEFLIGGAVYGYMQFVAMKS